MAAIEAFCRKWKVREFSLFGSVVTDDFGPNSDIDVLVSFEDPVPWGLFDIVRMESELRELFGRPVDLVERKGIEQSPNYLRRRAILDAAEPVYVA